MVEILKTKIEMHLNFNDLAPELNTVLNNNREFLDFYNGMSTLSLCLYQHIGE